MAPSVVVAKLADVSPVEDENTPVGASLRD